jgi:D-lyxose ketol-isomerase
MLTRRETEKWRRRSVTLFRKAGIVLTPREERRIEIADFGLGQFERTGLGVLVYVNTDRSCAKELGMLPGQTCPEHRHPPIGASNPGKEETFRCRWGTVYLYVPGAPARRARARPPVGREAWYTVRHEILLRPGDQYTLGPDTLHWFQAGPKGAVVSEFSTRSTDENDIFTDPGIRRITANGVASRGRVAQNITTLPL